jgi:thymidylate synthase
MNGLTTRVSDIRELFKNSISDPTTGMLEIYNASFIADEPAIFGTVNEDWNLREREWYLSQSLYVTDIPAPIPQIWLNVASKDSRINSNYGWCVFSSENFKQYENVVNSLKNDKNTRQASLIYNRPSMHLDSNDNGMKDFMCTFAQQVLIRENKLIFIVFQRSMDAVFGYKGDYAWASYLQDKLLEDLLPTYPELIKGDILWNAASLHVYPRHLHLVK